MAFFKKRTVEEIVAPITKIVDQLKDHASAHSDKAADHNSRAAEHMELASFALVEAERAKNAASKIAGLVTV